MTIQQENLDISVTNALDNGSDHMVFFPTTELEDGERQTKTFNIPQGYNFAVVGAGVERIDDNMTPGQAFIVYLNHEEPPATAETLAYGESGNYAPNDNPLWYTDTDEQRIDFRIINLQNVTAALNGFVKFRLIPKDA